MNTDNRNNQKDERSNIPENDPSNAMDSKREVEHSKDPRTDEDFPGYPHYPAKEDMMDQRSGEHRVDNNLEEMPNGYNSSGVSQRFITQQESKKTGGEKIADEAQQNEDENA